MILFILMHLLLENNLVFGHLMFFKTIYSILNTNGILVTYCAKGQVRRDLESVGLM